jgi:hypothetical protein
VNIAVQLEPTSESAPEVRYTWDPDTDILSARVHPAAAGEGVSGSVEVGGEDGSWLILDVAAGRINGVEVAVWPEVQKLSSLAPPAASAVQDAHVKLSRAATAAQQDVAALQVETPVLAESDHAERVIHFRLGKARAARAIRVARDLLLEVDRQSRLAGLWLLNVPPFPEDV